MHSPGPRLQCFAALLLEAVSTERPPGEKAAEATWLLLLLQLAALHSPGPRLQCLAALLLEAVRAALRDSVLLLQLAAAAAAADGTPAKVGMHSPGSRLHCIATQAR